MGKILWGSHPAHCGGAWLKLCVWTRADEKRRRAEGWELMVLAKGVAPVVNP